MLTQGTWNRRGFLFSEQGRLLSGMLALFFCFA